MFPQVICTIHFLLAVEFMVVFFFQLNNGEMERERLLLSHSIFIYVIIDRIQLYGLITKVGVFITLKDRENGY